jgi:hypothetical protein
VQLYIRLTRDAGELPAGAVVTGAMLNRVLDRGNLVSEVCDVVVAVDRNNALMKFTMLDAQRAMRNAAAAAGLPDVPF